VTPELEPEIDRLYGLDLDEFTSERDKLARTLRKEGRRDEADEVKGLKKPTVAAWAVNQLARGNRRDVDLLLDAGHRLREAQRGVLGGADREAFDQARRTERKALDNLTKAAEQSLGKPTAAMLDRVAKTLQAAVVTDEGRELLARGRLTEDFELTGFEALAPLAEGVPRRSARPPKPKQQTVTKPGRPADERRKRIDEAKETVRAAKERERDLAKGLREAERVANDARRATEQAEKKLDALRAQAENAAQATRAAEQHLRDAQRR
jgi:hypothetical protein